MKLSNFAKRKKKTSLIYKNVFSAIAGILVVLISLWIGVTYYAMQSGSMEAFYYFTKSNAISALNNVDEMSRQVQSTLVSLALEPEITEFWLDGLPDKTDIAGAKEILSFDSAVEQYNGNIYIYNEKTNMVFQKNSGENLPAQEVIELIPELPQVLEGKPDKRAIKKFFIPGTGIYDSKLFVAYYPHSFSGNCIIKQISGMSFIRNFNSLNILEKCKYALYDENEVLYSNFFMESDKLKEFEQSYKGGESLQKAKIGKEKCYCAIFEVKSVPDRLMVFVPEHSIYSNKIFDKTGNFLLGVVIVLIIILIIGIVLWKVIAKYEIHIRNIYLMKKFKIDNKVDRQRILEEIIEKSEQIEWETIPEKEFAVFLHGSLVLTLLQLEKNENETEGEEDCRKYCLVDQIKDLFTKRYTECVVLEERMI